MRKTPVASFAVLAVLLPFAVSAQEPAPEVQIVVNSVPGAVNSYVEVPVTLETNGLEPAVLVFGFVFDATRLDLFDVEAGPVVTDADKQITFVPAENGLNVVVAGINATTLGDGHLMTVTFQVLNTAQVGEELDIVGSGHESAASPDELSIPAAVVPGTVTVTADQTTHLLTIVVTGEGETDPAEGVHAVLAGDTVQLEAFPAAGYRFSRWEGAVSSSRNPVNVVMDKDKVVTAVFVEGISGIQCPAVGGTASGSTGGGGPAALSLALVLLVCWTATRYRRAGSRES